MKKQHARFALIVYLAASSICLASLSLFYLAISPAQAQAERTRVSLRASFNTRNRTAQVVQVTSFSFISDGSGKEIRGTIQFSQEVPSNVNPPKLRSINTTSITTAVHERTPNRVILRGEALQAYAGVSGCSYRGTVNIILRDRYPDTDSLRRFEDNFRVTFTPTPNQQIPRQCTQRNALPASTEWSGNGDIRINTQNLR